MSDSGESDTLGAGLAGEDGGAAGWDVQLGAVEACGVADAQQRKAAKDFLNWLAEDKEGQEFISTDAALISPFKNNDIEASDPLGKSVKSYADAGKLIGNYNYLPDDHYSVLGAAFQKWLAGEEDRAGLAQDIQDYWKTAKFTGATA